LRSREPSSPFPPGLALILAVFAISWGSILVRLCSAGPLVIACYRVGLAAALLTPFAMRKGARRRLSARVSLRVFLAGLLLAVHFGAWIWSLHLTSIGNSVLLVSSQPLFAAFLSGAILGERAPARAYAGIGVSLAGMILISGGDLGLSPDRFVGDLLAVVAAVAGAGYFVIGRQVRADLPFVTYLFWVYAASAALLGIAAWCAGQPLTGLRPADYAWLSAMAVVPSIIGHGGLNWAVRHVRVFLVSLAAFGEPILATLYARLLFREPIPPVLISGASLIFAGILISLPRFARAPAQGSAP